MAERGDVFQLKRRLGFGAEREAERLIIVQATALNSVLPTLLAVPLEPQAHLFAGQPLAVLVSAGEAGAAADHVAIASWVHVEDEDWRARVASWLPAHGVDAWIVQRDVADPALYVGTWLQDGDADPRDPFDFYAAQYVKQLVAGYSKNTPQGGLRVYMPDYNEASGTDLKPR